MKVDFLQVDHGVVEEDLGGEGAQVVVTQQQGLDLVRLGEGGEAGEPGALQCQKYKSVASTPHQHSFAGSLWHKTGFHSWKGSMIGAFMP